MRSILTAIHCVMLYCEIHVYLNQRDGVSAPASIWHFVEPGVKVNCRYYRKSWRKNVCHTSAVISLPVLTRWCAHPQRKRDSWSVDKGYSRFHSLKLWPPNRFSWLHSVVSSEREVVVVVVSLLRMCEMHKHIQSHIKHLNEINDYIKIQNTELWYSHCNS